MDGLSTQDQRYLSVPEVAERLNVDRRSVLRYIETGIASPNGTRIRLLASSQPGLHGPEYQVGPSDLETFEKVRALPLKQRSAEQLSGAQLVAGELELERLHQDVQSHLSIIADLLNKLQETEAIAGELRGENILLRAQLETVEARRRRGIIQRVCDVIFGEVSPTLEGQKRQGCRPS